MEQEGYRAPLPGRALVSYGVLGFPLALLGYPLGIWLPRAYGTDIGIDLALVGLVISAAAFFDAITDPVIGFASDRVRMPFGRRRSWIGFGAPLLALAIWMLLNPGQGTTVAYLAFWYLFLRVGSTLVLVPWGAVGAELSPTYHMRTLLNSWRQRFGIAGLIAAAFVPFFVELLLGEGATALLVLKSYSWLVVIFLPLATVAYLLWVPEPDHASETSTTPFFRSLALMWKNGLFRRVLVIELVITGGEAFRNALSLFFIQDAIGIRNAGQLYVIYFVVGLAAIALWDRLARRFGKHRALATAMALVSVDSIAIFVVFLLDWHKVELFYVLFAVKGLCYGAFSYLPLAMLGDVVDIDTARSKDARTGSYFALHGFMTKCAASFGGLSLPILALTGYSASRDAVNTMESLTWLGALYAIVPTALFVFAFWVCWTWPLTAERHARLRARIDRLTARRAPAAAVVPTAAPEAAP